MLTLEYVVEHINEIEQDDFIDKRFTKRFLDYIPVEKWNEYGFTYAGESPLLVKEWTEENILNQLKEDVAFGIEKAKHHRGISASLMFDVVNSWCKILENGLDSIRYENCWYGDKLFIAVDKMYDFGLVDETTFSKEFYKEW